MFRFNIIVLAGLAMIATPVFAQPILSGHITSMDGEPVPFANVTVQGSTLGVAASVDGMYNLELPDLGTYVISISAIGFKAQEREILFERQTPLRLNFTMEESILESDGIVVTGTMTETYVKDSPVKVEVVSAQYLQKTPSANLTEVIENVNGLYNQIDCGVCYTNNIRINGMDGPYTAVLIDGMPIMSSLSSVYGLNGISPTMIKQVEVVKGPVSTLYGTEALSGVINIITKNPEHTPRLAINSFASSDEEMNLDLAVVPSRGRFASLVSGSLFRADHFVDRNQDGFSDFTLDTRVTFFGKGILKNDAGFDLFKFSTKYYYEDRMGGTEPYIDASSKSIRGSSDIYGESIFTRRVEALGTYHMCSLKRVFNWMLPITGTIRTASMAMPVMLPSRKCTFRNSAGIPVPLPTRTC